MDAGAGGRSGPDQLEVALRRGVLAGDAAAWTSLYERTWAALDADVRLLCGGEDALADDVLQETWMVAVKRLRSWDPARASFLAWMRGIARHSHLALRRRAARRRGAPLDEQAAPQPPRNPEGQHLLRVRATLLRLPRRYRAVLEAKYVDRLSVAEIATSWKTSLKSIESLLTRARNAFRESFPASEDGED